MENKFIFCLEYLITEHEDSGIIRDCEMFAIDNITVLLATSDRRYEDLKEAIESVITRAKRHYKFKRFILQFFKKESSNIFVAFSNMESRKTN